ncbi:MAG: T9SS type A sorting domain-containing protein [Phycisphaerae bacterium]|nr:T9SS type A sorting domain-containing protein [Phycisphaerae bacterium]NIV69453.1 T9SS type A sorting domain-containing protein [Phycisphaerae bacterium]NIW92474.1 T9SS type A sorting domain-containing protein [Phycisphaerae bacterium]
MDAKTLSEGARLHLDGGLWDFAGAVPAASQEMYSAIAPTLYDSTKTSGMHWSVFKVVGHTGNPAIFATSAPDSGYSLDNLVPAAPTNLAGEETESGVVLSWDDPVDEDFDYFAVYRSTIQGFNPGSTDPIARVTKPSYTDQEVEIGTTYYYRLSAFDFSGNEGPFSTEFSLLVVSVDDHVAAAIPEDYVLEQNYPNPFNPSTTITFGLKESGHVTLTVFNALGEEVMEVINNQMEAGHHRVVLGAEKLATGMYFYNLRVNGFTAVKKMIVMK